MKLTKEDYMRLPKERLAELLVEKKETITTPEPTIIPYGITMPNTNPKCYEPGGVCTNPQMDCINCPRKTTGGVYITSPNTDTGISTLKGEGNSSFTDGKEHNPSFID